MTFSVHSELMRGTDAGYYSNLLLASKRAHVTTDLVAPPQVFSDTEGLEVYRAWSGHPSLAFSLSFSRALIHPTNHYCKHQSLE